MIRALLARFRRPAPPPPPELSDAARRLSAEAAAKRRAAARLRREDRSAWVKAHCAQILASMRQTPEQQELFHE